jgi:hypothetical protein
MPVTRSLSNSFVRNHISFIVGIPSVIILLSLLFWFVSNALTAERSFEIQMNNQDGRTETINSEEIKLQAMTDDTKTTEHAQSYMVEIVNVSGEPGAAANAAMILDEAGILVDSVRPDLERIELNSIIIADVSTTGEASQLSSLFNGALVSSVESMKDGKPLIQILVGRDMLDK